MPRIAVNMAGGSYKHASSDLSAQATRNFYPQLQDIGNEKSGYTLEPWYGKTLFSGVAGTGSRGITEHNGILYHVVGITLYSVDVSGVHTEEGQLLAIRPQVPDHRIHRGPEGRHPVHWEGHEGPTEVFQGCTV